jgi:small subunit ribosomal protein S21
MRVEVKNGNVDRAIRTLKKKLVEDGLFRKLQAGLFYEKPSEERRRLKRAAIARQRRELAKN